MRILLSTDLHHDSGFFQAGAIADLPEAHALRVIEVGSAVLAPDEESVEVEPEPEMETEAEAADPEPESEDAEPESIVEPEPEPEAEIVGHGGGAQTMDRKAAGRVSQPRRGRR